MAHGEVSASTGRRGAYVELPAVGKNGRKTDICGLPALTAANAETRRAVFDAFRLIVALDRDNHQIHVEALISSTFTKANDLQQLA